jgi:hypothetical protein
LCICWYIINNIAPRIFRNKLLKIPVFWHVRACWLLYSCRNFIVLPDSILRVANPFWATLKMETVIFSERWYLYIYIYLPIYIYIYIYIYTMLCPRRFQFSSASLWEPHIIQQVTFFPLSSSVLFVHICLSSMKANKK